MEKRHRDRMQLSCGEAGEIIAAVGKTLTTLIATKADVDEIKKVAQRLHTEVGWPQEVVDAHLKEMFKENYGQ